MLKAIETQYKGYRFRSRLEARWAVFFDALSVPWEYEKEGYDLGAAGWYLPDFWLPKVRVWIEIKGEQPTEIEMNKLAALTQAADDFGLIVCGTPREERCYLPDEKTWLIIPEEERGGIQSWWVWCDIACHIDKHPDHKHSSDSVCPRIERAYTAARSARFEHGEQP